MADTTTELEVLDQIVGVLGGQSGQYETVVPVLQQIKELIASGITDPESIAEAVTAWLDEHPEATTTVQDGSITVMKLAQDVIELLDDKADIDGYYSQLTAGLAENLIGRGDAVPAEYLYRTAGGTADIEDGIATIDCIKGNTLVWNQMVQNGNFTSDTGWQTGVSAKSVANGVITISNTTSTYMILARTTGTPLIAGHKYYIGFTASSTGGSVMIIPTQGGAGGYTTISGISSKKRVGWIYVPSSEETFYAGLRFPVTTAGTSEEITSTIEDYITVDLTLMFGAGNEPATVEEFEAMFPLPYYPYSVPKLLPVDIRGIETVGFNAYNPSTGEAELLGGHQYQISGTYTQLSYSTGESIALDSDGIFTPSDNGTLTVTGGNATDTCVHLVWSGYRNGEYEKHWSAERPIDTSRFFPTGMKKVGDKADALYADHYDTVVGAVDLGTLTWTAYSGGFYSYAIADALAGSATNGYDHITCAPYTSQNVASLSELSDKCCSIDSGRYIQVKDSSYTTAADFTAAMSGVMLYYELAEPTTVPIDPPINLSYKVSDFGTERIMVDETADAPQSAPVPMEVEYGINAIDTIRRLPTEYQSHKSMGQLTAALESSLGIDITETWDEDDQRYEYEATPFELADDAVTPQSLSDEVLHGQYPSLSVGRADALTGADETSQWSQHVTEGSGSATVRSVQGAAVAFNQLVPLLNAENAWTKTASINTTFSEDGTAAILTSNTDTSTSKLYKLSASDNLVAGHIYYLSAFVTPPDSSTATFGIYKTNGTSDVAITVTVAGRNRYTNIAAATAPSYFAIRLNNGAMVGNSATFEDVQLFDLTLMFGAGNEPATVAEFEAMYPEAYYPYSAPVLKPVQIAGIASTDAQGGELDSVEWTAQTLRAAGSVADMLYSDHVDVRVGVVDLGTLTWTYETSGTVPFFRSKLPSDYAAPTTSGIDNLECAKYEAGTSVTKSWYGSNDRDKSIRPIYGQNYNVGVQDSSYTDAATFKEAMDGVLLFYELVTPTLTPISPALPMTYRVEQGGTEAIIVPEGEISAVPIITVAEGESAADLVMDALACIATPDGPVATANHSVGTYLTMQGKLYKVTSAIAVGETVVAGTNVTQTTVMAELIALTQ